MLGVKVKKLLARGILAGVAASAAITAVATPAFADSAPATGGKLTAVETVKPRQVGVQFQGLWSNYTDAQRENVLNRLQQAGVTTVRMDVSWITLQPTGPTSYDPWGLSFIDKVVNMANARGIKPLMTLWLTPSWANGGRGQRALPTNPADYARVAKFAATRWKGKTAGWEVWNEANSTNFMVGADPAAYVKLLKAAYPAIKAADPAAPVVFAGMEYNDDAWISRAYAAGAKGYFDVMATHPYMGIANADPTQADDGTKWTLMHVAAVRNVMVANGDSGKGIWFTEFGWSTHTNAAGTPNWLLGVSEATQSAYVYKTAKLVAERLPYVQKMYLYNDRDATSGNQHYNNFGIFRLNYTSKPVLGTISTINHA